MIAKIFESRLLGAMIVGTFALLHLSVSLRQALTDADKSPQFRVQRAYDDTQNSVRAESIVKYGYRDNPVMPVGMPQFFLMTAVLTHHLVPSSYSRNARFMIALRVTAALAFALSLIAFYCLVLRLFAPSIALWVWSAFASSTAYYVASGYVAKENSLALLLTLLIFLVWESHGRRPHAGKLFLSAVLIGIGGSTKQYPLLLSLLLLPLAWELRPTVRSRLLLIAALAFVSAAALILSNPPYYLAHVSLAKASELALQDRQTGPASWREELARSLHVLWHLLGRVDAIVWITALILAVARRFSAARPAPALAFLRRHAVVIFGYLAVYYALSLYKQNYYDNVSYFLIGEILLLLVFGALLQQLCALERRRVRIAALALALAATARVSWNAGHFNYTNGVAEREHALYELRHSTNDRLIAELRAMPPESRASILSQWFIYLPPGEFPVKYLLPSVLPKSAGFLDELQVPYLLEPLSRELIRREKTELVLAYEDIRPASGLDCLSVRREIPGPTFPVHRTYPGAVLAYHRAYHQFETAPAETLPLGGPPFILFDATGCW